jgi:hypothetical protein
VDTANFAAGVEEDGGSCERTIDKELFEHPQERPEVKAIRAGGKFEDGNSVHPRVA